MRGNKSKSPKRSGMLSKKKVENFHPSLPKKQVQKMNREIGEKQKRETIKNN